MATTKLMTIDDLCEIEEPGRYDLIRGELRSMAPAGQEHGEIEMNILSALWDFVREQRLGRVYPGDTGFILSASDQTVLSPDASFVSTERVPTENKAPFLPISPDFAVEIVSPSDRSTDLLEKVVEYLNAGTQLVWVVDRRMRMVTAYTSGLDAHVYTDTDMLDCGDVIPGFQIRVSDIFR